MNETRKHNPKLTKTAKMLRKTQTKEERRLWYEFLSKYPTRFLRQKVIDNYIVDFYCHKAKLVIELDGIGHYFSKAEKYDLERDLKLESRNLFVLRIPNIEINKNFEGVCNHIDQLVQERVAENQQI
jgi:very-short-patch-repair endonuclease